ncbi:hypothetical protein PRZ48_013895 [Zasmidium cellare]|uniref:Uncharacterized protein n=1 Tax=Zasmidium cellare TaxID=395010 RepID=A0ABR0DZF6_ZASCE|nr:hypothetical protein PRZ48_013895 [Zasmidium cellare]
MPNLVPTLDLSAVSRTKRIGGVAMNTPEKNPNSKVTTTIPPRLTTPSNTNSSTLHVKAPVKTIPAKPKKQARTHSINGPSVKAVMSRSFRILPGLTSIFDTTIGTSNLATAVKPMILVAQGNPTSSINFANITG